jgi:hypothetical protein
MATAARFSADAGSLAGSRINAAQRAAIFRLVDWSKGQIIPLDYNTPALDEMTNTVVPAKAGTHMPPGMTGGENET